MIAAHTLLLKASDDRRSDAALVEGAQALAGRLGLASNGAAIMRGVTESTVYVYVDLPETLRVEDLQRSASAIGGPAPFLGPPLRLARLARCRDIAGASAGGVGDFHYVVETDVDGEAAWDDLVQWYDAEHMPGLAAVPGCLRARRYVNLDGGPRSYACYDLAAPDVLGSAAWLAVRNTPWSARVRPRFCNTSRTMFRAVATTGGGPQ